MLYFILANNFVCVCAVSGVGKKYFALVTIQPIFLPNIWDLLPYRRKVDVSFFVFWKFYKMTFVQKNLNLTQVHYFGVVSKTRNHDRLLVRLFWSALIFFFFSFIPQNIIKHTDIHVVLPDVCVRLHVAINITRLLNYSHVNYFIICIELIYIQYVCCILCVCK